MKQFEHKEIVAYIVLALFVFGYIISRALVGEMVHDEAVFSYMYKPVILSHPGAIWMQPIICSIQHSHG